MNNIYLIGMPGCGKSTIGKIISGEINMAFVDLDNALLRILRDTLKYLESTGEETDPMTRRTYDYYCELKEKESENGK